MDQQTFEDFCNHLGPVIEAFGRQNDLSDQAVAVNTKVTSGEKVAAGYFAVRFAVVPNGYEGVSDNTRELGAHVRTYVIFCNYRRNEITVLQGLQDLRAANDDNHEMAEQLILQDADQKTQAEAVYAVVMRLGSEHCKLLKAPSTAVVRKIVDIWVSDVKGPASKATK